MLALAGIYGATSAEILLLVIAFSHLEMLAWVACVLPLLSVSIGSLLLFLPAINRALWHSASMSAQLMSSALGGHRFAMAAVDAAAVLMVTLSVTGSAYLVTGLARRAAAAGCAGRAGGRAAAG